MYLLSHSTANRSLFNLAIFASKTSKNLLQKNKEVYMKMCELITLITVNFLHVSVTFCGYLQGGDRYIYND